MQGAQGEGRAKQSTAGPGQLYKQLPHEKQAAGSQRHLLPLRQPRSVTLQQASAGQGEAVGREGAQRDCPGGAAGGPGQLCQLLPEEGHSCSEQGEGNPPQLPAHLLLCPTLPPVPEVGAGRALNRAEKAFTGPCAPANHSRKSCSPEIALTGSTAASAVPSCPAAPAPDQQKSALTPRQAINLSQPQPQPRSCWEHPCAAGRQQLDQPRSQLQCPGLDALPAHSKAQEMAPEKRKG